MARVGGINIPDNKHIDVSLTHIYGIGRKTAQNICDKLSIKYTRQQACRCFTHSCLWYWKKNSTRHL